MIREIDAGLISPDKLLKSSDMARLGCNDCRGCSECCRDRAEAITLDPYDMRLLKEGLNYSFEGLLEQGLITLTIVDGVILPALGVRGVSENASTGSAAAETAGSAGGAAAETAGSAGGTAAETAGSAGGAATDPAGSADSAATDPAGSADSVSDDMNLTAGFAVGAADDAEHATDPHLAAGDASEESTVCVFLGDDGRCGIHAFRPGICRMFPLARIWHEDGSFSYFLQQGECSRANGVKIRISKWLGYPDINGYERSVRDFHDALRKLRGKLQKDLSHEEQVLLERLFLEEWFIR